MKNIITLAVLTLTLSHECNASKYVCDNKEVSKKDALTLLETKKSKECFKIDKLILKNALGIEKSR